MIVYIAITTLSYTPYEELRNADILSSYYYCKENRKLLEQIPHMRNFLLDSGVFTFINSGKEVNINKYIQEYAAFIKANNIRNYVELDVDQIYGVKETRKIRDRLENLVGWQSIPVWHTIRGQESFVTDCKEYERICLGYFLTEGLPPKLTEKYTPYFIDMAHKYNCKIHGLGFTKTSMLSKFKFDSVDSSTWSAGKRYGQTHIFDEEKGIIKAIQRPIGTKAKGNLIESYNLKQWKRFQEYALVHY